jgi:hypothetical protein
MEEYMNSLLVTIVTTGCGIRATKTSPGSNDGKSPRNLEYLIKFLI